MRDDETIHDRLDGMLFITVEFDLFVERMDSSIHAGTGETCFADLLEDGLVCAFTSAYQRGEDQDACAIGKILEVIHDLFVRLLDHDASAHGTMGDACTRKQQTHVVVDFSNSTNCRA